MKKIIAYILLSALCIHSYAQSSYFNTITLGGGKTKPNMEQSIEGTDSATAYYVLEQRTKGKYDDYTKQELEWMINEYVKRKEEKAKAEKGNYKIWKFYEEEGKPLNMANLLKVMEEVGISNRLHVLAQAVLESSWFKSNVCQSYNNLFGLYDSTAKDYYHFERWEDSVVGYKKFIQNKYKGGNYLMFLQRIGYAEDPQYIYKVAKVMRCLVKEKTKNT